MYRPRAATHMRSCTRRVCVRPTFVFFSRALVRARARGEPEVRPNKIQEVATKRNEITQARLIRMIREIKIREKVSDSEIDQT